MTVGMGIGTGPGVWNYFQGFRTKDAILKHENVIVPCLTRKRTMCFVLFLCV